jgi:hypothetical protein
MSVQSLINVEQMKPKREIQDYIQNKDTEFLRVFCSEMRSLYSEQSSNLFVCLQCEQKLNSLKKCLYCQTEEFVVPDNQLSQQYLKSQNQSDHQSDQMKASLKNSLDIS